MSIDPGRPRRQKSSGHQDEVGTLVSSDRPRDGVSAHCDRVAAYALGPVERGVGNLQQCGQVREFALRFTRPSGRDTIR